MFKRRLYFEGVDFALEHELDFTDDCQLMEAIGVKVCMTTGDYKNIKITTPEDIKNSPTSFTGGLNIMRIGHGYDVHRLTENRKLILGGVEIPYEKGLLGHSDADVLTHAVMDAFLGALALGDIGKHFPDNDPEYKGADSIKLLEHVYRLIINRGYKLGNLDAVVLAQAPNCLCYSLIRCNHRMTLAVLKAGSDNGNNHLILKIAVKVNTVYNLNIL